MFVVITNDIDRMLLEDRTQLVVKMLLIKDIA